MSRSSSNPPRCSLSSIFTQYARREDLIKVFSYLRLCDIASLIRTCKYVYHIFITSPDLQLRHRLAHLSVPSTLPLVLPPSLRSSREPTSADKIDSLLERERRLDELQPSSSGHWKDFGEEHVAIRSGHMLARHREGLEGVVDRGGCGRVGESLPGTEGSGKSTSEAESDVDRLRKTVEGILDPKDGPLNWSSWSVVRLPGVGTDADALARGGTKEQGLWSWRTEAGTYTQAMDMCVEDNVVVALTGSAHFTTNPPSIDHAYLAIRMWFFTLLPSRWSTCPPNGRFDPIPHPEEPLPYIELLYPVNPNKPMEAKCELSPGGRVVLRLEARGPKETLFLGAWDWKKGISLGMMAPSPEIPILATNYNLLGPLMVVSAIRKTPVTCYPEDYSSWAEGPGLPSKMPPANEVIFDFSLDTYALLPPSRGTPPHDPLPNIDPGGERYRPRMPCTWEASSMQCWIPLRSHQLPPIGYVPGSTIGDTFPRFLTMERLSVDGELIVDGEHAAALSFSILDRTNIVDLPTLVRGSLAALHSKADQCLLSQPEGQRAVDSCSDEAHTKTRSSQAREWAEQVFDQVKREGDKHEKEASRSPRMTSRVFHLIGETLPGETYLPEGLLTFSRQSWEAWGMTGTNLRTGSVASLDAVYGTREVRFLPLEKEKESSVELGETHDVHYLLVSSNYNTTSLASAPAKKTSPFDTFFGKMVNVAQTGRDGRPCKLRLERTPQTHLLDVPGGVEGGMRSFLEFRSERAELKARLIEGAKTGIFFDGSHLVLSGYEPGGLYIISF
ncbi:hypothetical protein IAT38_004191 [Cryptococcus sp. DSM 104549]